MCVVVHNFRTQMLIFTCSGIYIFLITLFLSCLEYNRQNPAWFFEWVSSLITKGKSKISVSRLSEQALVRLHNDVPQKQWKHVHTGRGNAYNYTNAWCEQFHTNMNLQSDGKQRCDGNVLKVSSLYRFLQTKLLLYSAVYSELCAITPMCRSTKHQGLSPNRSTLCFCNMYNVKASKTFDLSVFCAWSS